MILAPVYVTTPAISIEYHLAPLQQTYLEHYSKHERYVLFFILKKKDIYRTSRQPSSNCGNLEVNASFKAYPQPTQNKEKKAKSQLTCA